MAELEGVLATSARELNSGLIVMPDGLYDRPSRGHHFVGCSLSCPYRLSVRIFAEVGGLVSYGSSALDEFRRAAPYADRILKGVKPSELPVQTPIKFDL